MPPGMVWLLSKCAYCLIDAPLLWYKRVYEFLSSLGAIRSPADHELFVLSRGGDVVLAVAVHVDDFLYIGTPAGTALLQRELKAAFSVGPFRAG